MKTGINLTRDLWRKIYRNQRINTYVDRADRSHFAERERLARKIAMLQRDGLVGFNTHQMDCDCASWSSFENVPAHTMAVEFEIDKLYRWAEGPCSHWLSEPDAMPQGSYGHHDHALEAFENGHPHSVCY